MLAGRQPFGVLMWFQLFCFFHLVSAVRLTDQGSHFSFATSICGLFFLSFFLCHRHLWSVLSFMAFSAVGIRVRLFVFALLALVSGYQCISQFLLSCSALAARQLHPWRFELDFVFCFCFLFCKSCGQPYKFRFEANPIWYSTIKFTKSHSAK